MGFDLSLFTDTNISNGSKFAFLPTLEGSKEYPKNLQALDCQIICIGVICIGPEDFRALNAVANGVAISFLPFCFIYANTQLIMSYAVADVVTSGNRAKCSGHNYLHSIMQSIRISSAFMYSS